MRKFITVCLATAIAFLSGLSAVWIVDISYKAEMRLAKSYPDLIFQQTMRGCGCGFTQYYNLWDSRIMSEQNTNSVCNDDTRNEVEVMLSEATNIIQREIAVKENGAVDNDVIFGYDKIRERVVFLYFSDVSQEERAAILWHGESGYYLIDAPDLNSAETFEVVKEKISTR